MLPHVNYDLMIKARLNQAHELTINISKPGVVRRGDSCPPYGEVVLIVR